MKRYFNVLIVALGAHTAEVLSALGYDAAAQKELKEQSVI